MCKSRVWAIFISSTAGMIWAFSFQMAEADCQTSVWGVQLANYVMSTLTIGDIDSCYRTCAAKPGCRSINYYRDKSLCELNSRTIENTPQMTVINEDSVYFKIPDAREQIIMIFPQASLKDKVVLENWFENLTAFTVCSWNQAVTKYQQALFSYATADSTNEIYVELLTKDWSTTFLHVYQTVWRSPSGEAVYPVDGDWHHFCLTWENNRGEWKIFIDGAEKSKGIKNPGRVISGKGAIILGQDQDTVVKGGFDLSQSYQGNLTNVNLWDRVLAAQEVADLSRACSVGEGNVIMWSDFLARVDGDIEVLHVNARNGCAK